VTLATYFTAGKNDTGNNYSPARTTPVKNLSPAITTPTINLSLVLLLQAIKLLGRMSFIGDYPFISNIFKTFRKNSKWIQWGIQGHGRN
jgi:hypothetical protein